MAQPEEWDNRIDVTASSTSVRVCENPQMSYGEQTSARRSSTAGIVCRVATALSVPLVLVSVTGLLQFTRSERAVSEASWGSTLATMGVGMLVLGGVGWLIDRRASRRGDGSRAAAAFAVLSVLWPLWILFVRWYDGR